MRLTNSCRNFHLSDPLSTLNMLSGIRVMPFLWQDVVWPSRNKCRNTREDISLTRCFGNQILPVVYDKVPTTLYLARISWCLYFPSSQIAIMGCIVNGPGEMADADFGYVGGAPGKIDLYVGKVIHIFTSFHARYALSSPSNLLLLLRSSTCSLWHWDKNVMTP